MSEHQEPAGVPLGGQDTPADLFIRMEYEALQKWAMHGEDTAHRVFHFYITVLTATLGALLLLGPLVFPDTRASATTVILGCGLLILVGVVFFDALVSESIRHAHHAYRLEAIRTYYREQSPATAHLIDPPLFQRELDEMRLRPRSGGFAGRLFTVSLSRPASVQRSFIALVDSLLLGTLLCAVAWRYVAGNARSFAMAAAALGGIALGFLCHALWQERMIQRNLDRIQPPAEEAPPPAPAAGR
jgi:hypothetical protein